MAGVEVVDRLHSFAVDCFSTSLGTASVLSVRSRNMREPLSRGRSRDREWLDRGRGLFDRVFKDLIETRAGRVGGSIIVTFLATWTSAFSTEKIDDGEDERDLEFLLTGGESGAT